MRGHDNARGSRVDATAGIVRSKHSFDDNGKSAQFAEPANRVEVDRGILLHTAWARSGLLVGGQVGEPRLGRGLGPIQRVHAGRQRGEHVDGEEQGTGAGRDSALDQLFGEAVITGDIDLEPLRGGSTYDGGKGNPRVGRNAQQRSGRSDCATHRHLGFWMSTELLCHRRHQNRCP